MADSGHLELFESLYLGRRLSDFAEILHDDTYACPQKMEGVKVGTGSRILLQEGIFAHSVLGHISTANQDILTKSGVYIDNEALQCAEWSKYASSKIQDGERRYLII